MAEYWEKFYDELTAAEKGGVGAILEVYNRETEKWQDDPVHFAEICYALELKAWHFYYDENVWSEAIDEIHCLYLALDDTVQYKGNFNDPEKVDQFRETYLSLAGP